MAQSRPSWGGGFLQGVVLTVGVVVACQYAFGLLSGPAGDGEHSHQGPRHHRAEWQQHRHDAGNPLFGDDTPHWSERRHHHPLRDKPLHQGARGPVHPRRSPPPGGPLRYWFRCHT